MQAIRVPYPLPTRWPGYSQLQSLEHWGRLVDFPERHITYVLWECRQQDVERAIFELVRSVERHRLGEEPKRLVIRFTE